jgi:hypothetical protein
MKYLRRGVSYKNIKLHGVRRIKMECAQIILTIILPHHDFYPSNFRPLKKKTIYLINTFIS